MREQSHFLCLFPKSYKAAVLPFCLWAFLLPMVLLPVQSSAQSTLNCDGNTQTLGFNGAFQDFIIPDDPAVVQIEFIAKGADGGFAQLDDDCKSEGGAGAVLSAIFNVGTGANDVAPGSMIRFVIGAAGENGTGGSVLGTGFSYGGGGGGTGILYKEPDSTAWTILAVAGGGGGAYQGRIIGFCVNNQEGQGGRAENSGGGGNGGIGTGSGGNDGHGGRAGFELSGGGGGVFSPGKGITCVEIIGTFEAGEGQAGSPSGGAGGGSEGCFGFTFRDGGFGFGGGGAGIGAGGGGGGYSGGGGGGTTGRGGGGGSFVNAINVSSSITAGNATSPSQNGFVQYKCILNSPPIAQCIATPLTVSLTSSGTIAITASQLDAGSSDPEGEALTFAVNPASFDCSKLGPNIVTLTLTDNSGMTAQCTAMVTIVDDSPPAITCPDNITVACDLFDLSATGMAGASDNCGVSDLSFLDAALSGDCDWECSIERIWTARDASGNAGSCTQSIVKTSLDVVEDALWTDVDGDGISDPIRLGYSRHTLTIGFEAAHCIMEWMPALNGGSSSALPRENYVVDAADCSLGNNPVDETGKLLNPLLAEALIMAINLRLDAQLGQTPLSQTTCTLDPFLNLFLGSNPTVMELFDLANLALGNLIGPQPFDVILDAVQCINGLSDKCAPEGGDLQPIAGVMTNGLLMGKSTSGIAPFREEFNFSLYPNPARSVVYFDLLHFEGEQVQISIYDQLGRVVWRWLSGIVDRPVLEARLSGLSAGMYVAELRSKGNRVVKKLIIDK